MVRTLQRWTINPLMRVPLAIGLNPLGLEGWCFSG